MGPCVSTSSKGQSELSSPVPDLVHAALFMLPRSLACADTAVSTMNLAKTGLSLLLRSFARAGVPTSVSGIASLGFVFFLFVADIAKAGSSMSARSITQPGPAVFALGSSHLGAQVLPRNYGRQGLVTLAVGIARMELVFFLPVTEVASSDVSMSLRSIGQLSTPPSVADMVNAWPPLFIRSLSRAGSAFLALQFAQLGSSLSLRQSACVGTPVLFFGLSCAGLIFAPSVIAHGSLGSSLMVRSSAKPSPALSAIGSANLGLLLLTRSFV